MTDLYAAAVDAADVEPDLEATTDFPDAPLPLIEVVVDEAGERKLRLVPETADVIASIEAELCVVAMCGPHRSGKSSLLNWLRDPAGSRGFTVGHGTSRQTKGLDVWGRPADIETESGAPAALLLIDVETRRPSFELAATAWSICAIDAFDDRAGRGDGWLGRGRPVRPDIDRFGGAPGVVARLQLAGRP